MSRLQPRTPISAAPLPGETRQHKQPTSVPLRIFATCLTSVIVAVHYTNYGPLIPTLIGDLHITGGQAGLLSTFLFLGLAVMYIRTFGSILLFGSIAITASFLAGPAVKRETT
ncbi:MAG: MFS transporter [Chloroflexi bacterium]|nr:MAG: MFS transporter [Chloroflexota bacterium]